MTVNDISMTWLESKSKQHESQWSNKFSRISFLCCKYAMVLQRWELPLFRLCYIIQNEFFLSGDKAKNRAKYYDIPPKTFETFDDNKTGAPVEIIKNKGTATQLDKKQSIGDETDTSGGKLRNYFPWPQTSNSSSALIQNPVCRTLLILLLNAGISLLSIAIKRPF